MAWSGMTNRIAQRLSFRAQGQLRVTIRSVETHVPEPAAYDVDFNAGAQEVYRSGVSPM
jgi:hypothetical protein